MEYKLRAELLTGMLVKNSSTDILGLLNPDWKTNDGKPTRHKVGKQQKKVVDVTIQNK